MGTDDAGAPVTPPAGVIIGPARSDAAIPSPKEFGERFDRFASSIGLGTPWSRDAALAAVVAVLSVALACAVVLATARESAAAVSASRVVLAAAVFAIQASVLAVRHRSPAWCLTLTAVAQVALILVLPGDLIVRGFASAIAAYSITAHRPLRPAAKLLAAVAAGEVVLGVAAALFVAPVIHPSDATLDVPGAVATFFVSPVANYAVFGLVGWVVATRRRYLSLVRRMADDEVRRQADRADAAARSERARMAREVHDIAAHHLSGIVVQAAAVERLIRTDPEAALETTRWIRTQGKETLANLRLAVGMLREGHGALDDGGAPVPGLDAVPAIIETERALGVDVVFTVEGVPALLGPVADVAFYRVIQESLANSREHAPGAAVTVRLEYGPSSVRLSVVGAVSTSTRPARERASDRGLGLIGMRERAELIGAHLEVGPTAAGGWSVLIELPTDDSREDPGSRP
ncbi:MAG: hypothetical protein RI885_1246 [Actinomycetota bacterium]